MTIEEHLLACLSEEAIEVSKEIHKMLRFGPGDCAPRTPGVSNADKLADEFNDLLAVAEMLRERKLLPLDPDPAKMKAKKAKVIRYLQYARQRGAVV